jgi:hypothetical protein
MRNIVVVLSGTEGVRNSVYELGQRVDAAARGVIKVADSQP